MAYFYKDLRTDTGMTKAQFEKLNPKERLQIIRMMIVDDAGLEVVTNPSSLVSNKAYR